MLVKNIISNTLIWVVPPFQKDLNYQYIEVPPWNTQEESELAGLCFQVRVVLAHVNQNFLGRCRAVEDKQDKSRDGQADIVHAQLVTVLQPAILRDE